MLVIHRPAGMARLLLLHLQDGLGKRLADQGHGLGAAEVVVAGVGGAAFPHGFILGRDHFRSVLFEVLLLLFGGHFAVFVGVAFALVSQVVAHALDFAELVREMAESDLREAQQIVR